MMNDFILAVRHQVFKQIVNGLDCSFVGDIKTSIDESEYLGALKFEVVLFKELASFGEKKDRERLYFELSLSPGDKITPHIEPIREALQAIAIYNKL